MSSQACVPWVSTLPPPPSPHSDDPEHQQQNQVNKTSAAGWFVSLFQQVVHAAAGGFLASQAENRRSADPRHRPGRRCGRGIRGAQRLAAHAAEMMLRIVLETALRAGYKHWGHCNEFTSNKLRLPLAHIGWLLARILLWTQGVTSIELGRDRNSRRGVQAAAIDDPKNKRSGRHAGAGFSPRMPVLGAYCPVVGGVMASGRSTSITSSVPAGSTAELRLLSQ